jgi:hypothetical protein
MEDGSTHGSVYGASVYGGSTIGGSTFGGSAAFGGGLSREMYVRETSEVLSEVAFFTGEPCIQSVLVAVTSHALLAIQNVTITYASTT